MNHQSMKNETVLRSDGDFVSVLAGGMRRAVPILGLALGGALLAGCGSSSSSSSSRTPSNGFEHASAVFADDEDNTYAESLEGGDNMDLPMYIQGFEADDDNRELTGDEANFRLRGGGSEVTIETPDGEFSWDNASASNGHFGAFRSEDTDNDGVLDTEAVLESYYLEYVHFGYWNEVSIDVDGDFAATGGAFRQGFETRPEDMPDSGQATYTGDTVGVGFHADHGEYEFDGTFELVANFESGDIGGWIETMFNEIDVNGGSINANTFAAMLEVVGGGDDLSIAVGETGDIDGTFFGPDADEIGGVWSLQDSDNMQAGALGGSQD